MLKGIRKKKIEKLFDFYDANGNGHLDMNDARLITDRFSDEFGWPKGSNQENRFKSAFLKIWTKMFRDADANHDHKVSRQEFEDYFELITFNDTQFYKFVKPMFDELFPAIDTDGDGILTKEDYKAFYRACDNSDDEAELAFRYMDRNKDGVISHLEFYNMLYHFYMSSNPRHNSKYFFGMVG